MRQKLVVATGPAQIDSGAAGLAWTAIVAKEGSAADGYVWLARLIGLVPFAAPKLPVNDGAELKA